MRPSIGCYRHHCRTIINSVQYKLQDSYNTLPFTPKSLLYLNSPSRINKASKSIALLAEKYPHLQIVSVTLDLKYHNAIGELWFDEPIGITSYYCVKRQPNLFDQTEFSTWIHDTKINIELPMNLFNNKSRLAYSMFYKDPHSKFSPHLSHLEISLPFDESETKFQVKSQMKALSPRLKLTELRDESKIITLNNKDAYKLFTMLKDHNETKGNTYRYALEISSLTRTDRCLVTIDPLEQSIMAHNITIDPTEKTYVKILQACLNDVKTPKIQNGLAIECYDPRKFQGAPGDTDIVINDVVAIGARYGFSVDGTQYFVPGDHAKVEAK